MKKLFFTLLMLLAGFTAFAQGHIDGIIVEKVSIPAAVKTAGSIPANAFTYRVFVDMADGWTLQSIYSDPVNPVLEDPGNPFFIETSTSFYNSSNGVSQGRSMSAANFTAGGPILYDSYLTIGSVTNALVGVPVNRDTDGTPDGYMAGTGLGLSFIPSELGDASGEIFGNSISATRRFDFNVGNGAEAGSSYGILGFQAGPAGSGNVVMIGQFTTDGDLSFELNIQIAEPASGAVENYTARPGRADEFVFAGLAYTSAVIAPTVSITSPASGSNFNTGEVVTITATASDANGTVTRVEFLRDGVSLGVDTDGTNGWSYAWTSVADASAVLTAIATDNDLNTTTSAPVTISVTTPANPAPTVSITAPTAGQTLNLGTAITLTAIATDVAPGTVTGVVFSNHGTPIAGTVTQSGNVWSLEWTPPAGSISITARATDNGGASTTSAAVSAYVQDPNAGFRIVTDSANCSEGEVFCMPIVVTTALSDVIGFDIPLRYDRSKVHPTGVVYVKSGSGALIDNYNWVSTYVNIVDVDGIMNISLAINGSAPAGTVFSGNGELICVEFVKTLDFGSVNTANFSVDAPGIYVSYATGVSQKLVTAGTYSTYKDEDFNATLLFWKDNSPIKYVSGTNLITNIFGSVNCVDRVVPAVQPNDDGKFVYNTALAKNIKIVRDIAPATDVQSVINGADAQLVARVVINDASYKPNIYQMMAMDVNRDSMVSAGDVTQIMQRAVGQYNEFKQADNYNVDGTKKAGFGASKDWVFLPSDVIYGARYRISENWPFTDGIGYSRFKLPLADTCHVVKIEGDTACPIIPERTYQGIMLGDVNGSYAGRPESISLKSTASSAVIFDVANAKIADGYVEVPVYFTSEEQVNSLDFALQFNEENFSLNSVVKQASDLETADHFNASDRTLRFTSYSLKSMEAGKNLVSIRFATSSNVMKSTDLSSLSAYINGNAVAVKMTEANMIADEPTVNVYPNPASDLLNVEVSVSARIVLMDMNGRSVLVKAENDENVKHQLNVSGIPSGMYMLKVYNKDFVSIKKVLIEK